MRVPDWYALLLLAGAAWRTFHFLAFDDIFDRPRRYITRLAPTWKQEGDATGDAYREKLASFLVCPFCFGWWCALVWWGLWLLWPHGTLCVAIGFVLSVVVIGAQRLLSAE